MTTTPTQTRSFAENIGALGSKVSVYSGSLTKLRQACPRLGYA